MIDQEYSWYSLETVKTFPHKRRLRNLPPSPNHKNGMTGCGFNSLLWLLLAMNSDPRAQIQDPRANRKWSGDELGSQIRALERPELLNYEVDSGGFWGQQDPPTAQCTTDNCGKYWYTYVIKFGLARLSPFYSPIKVYRTRQGSSWLDSQITFNMNSR